MNLENFHIKFARNCEDFSRQISTEVSLRGESILLISLRAMEERNKQKTSSRKPSLSKTSSKETVKTCKAIFDNKTKVLKLFCVRVD